MNNYSPAYFVKNTSLNLGCTNIQTFQQIKHIAAFILTLYYIEILYYEKP